MEMKFETKIINGIKKYYINNKECDVPTYYAMRDEYDEKNVKNSPIHQFNKEIRDYEDEDVDGEIYDEFDEFIDIVIEQIELIEDIEDKRIFIEDILDVITETGYESGIIKGYHLGFIDALNYVIKSTNKLLYSIEEAEMDFNF